MDGARRRWAAGLLSLAAAAGCASDMEPLPPAPPAAAPGESPPAPPERIPEPPRGEGLLDAAQHGERILDGLVLLDPALDPATGAASFRIRNEGDGDLPDLILAVVFAVPTGDPAVPLRPRIVTLEAPLRGGEERSFRAAPPALPVGGVPARFRVVAGPPELLAAAAGSASGTTFLGGLLECVALETDFTAAAPSISVALRARGPAAGPAPSGAAVLPSLEAQLLLARAGRLVWSGPWVLLPGPDDAAGGNRTLRWNLPREESLAGCSPFLRVREKR
ncbi:MAG: hypothetical protein L6R43_11015 [Planctomycetes bacterium]|nr:hypothetical protein [Planctomycetota bacterium]